MKIFQHLLPKLIIPTFVLANVFTSIGIPSTIASESPKKNPIITSQPGDYLRLISIRASEMTVGTRNIEYAFTINIPKSSQPIEKVTIAQRSGLEIIQFNPDKIKAYGSSKEQRNVKISQVNTDSKTQVITATFDTPVQPGQVLRVVIGVNENPFSDGNYLFNVAVYTQGESDNALSLGVGRLRITSIR
jgi:Protein of unknown function (DUF2808)